MRTLILLLAAITALSVGAGGATAALPRPVALTLEGHMTGPPDLSGAKPVVRIEGTWSSTGAFVDAGTYVESTLVDPAILEGGSGWVDVTKTLTGSRGTFVLRALAWTTWISGNVVTFSGGSWWLASGTGRYAHVRAGGISAGTGTADMAAGTIAVVHRGWAIPLKEREEALEL